MLAFNSLFAPVHPLHAPLGVVKEERHVLLRRRVVMEVLRVVGMRMMLLRLLRVRMVLEACLRLVTHPHG